MFGHDGRTAKQTAGHKKDEKWPRKQYLLREALHQNGDQQVEQHIVAERHQNDKIQRGPVARRKENGKGREKKKKDQKEIGGERTGR